MKTRFPPRLIAALTSLAVLVAAQVVELLLPTPQRATQVISLLAVAALLGTLLSFVWGRWRLRRKNTDITRK